jgi:cob(I)alamin adenosyltransferase
MPELTLIHGYGKGKTTAATGRLVQVVAADQRAAMVYFDKGFDGDLEHYSERRTLRLLASVSLHPTGCERLAPDGSFRFGVEPQDLEEARRGLTIARSLIADGAQQLLVLDEVLAAVAYKLLSRDDVESLVKTWETSGGRERHDLVLTGHLAWQSLKARADHVLEVRKVRHYFDEGTPARLGIEI